jgi:hypothetical protein
MAWGQLLSRTSRGPVRRQSALGPVLGAWAAAAPDSRLYDRTIARALQLLTRQPHKVVVADTYPPPIVGAKFRDIEAFVARGERIVYLMRQGPTLQQALKGSGIFDYALAIVIWHEMAHLDGADEPTAQREEETLWKEFILTRRVDSVPGLNYLAVLKKRR